MKYSHLLHVKNLEDVPYKYSLKIISMLEKATFGWAKKHEREAYDLTTDLKANIQTEKDKAKYFKYLRRLFELKLEYYEELAHKTEKNELKSPRPNISKDLQEALDIESLRQPEYLSCTQLQMFNFCPRKWYWRYARGIKVPPTTALHFGKAIDEALNFVFEEKIKGIKVPREAVYASFFEHFNLNKDEVCWGDDDPKLLEKNGPAIIDAYLDRFEDQTNPIDVQTEVKVYFKGGGYLLGYIDLLEKDEIIDNKTAAKPWNTEGPYAKQKDELQPKAYSLWYFETHGKTPKQFRYQIVTKETDENGKAIPQTQEVFVHIKKFELEKFKREVEDTWARIQIALKSGKKAFPAQAEKGYKSGMGLGCEKPGVLCTQEWCDYWQYCKKDGLEVPLRWQKRDGDKPGFHVFE